MKCPHCPTATLVITERSGIEIDYCPTCRGVWLDRGELDKIIERSFQQAPPPQQQYQAPPPQQQYQAPPQRPYYKKKRESWLSELFD